MMIQRICLIVLALLSLYANALAQNDVGTIIALKGTALFKQVDGKVERLTEKNFARSLQPNQRVKVDRNGQVQIILCDGSRPYVQSGKWYTLPSTVICSALANSAKRETIEKFFDIAARHRGENDFILFPTESKDVTDMIRPQTAVLRWAASTTARINLSVSVIGVENTTWKQDNVSGEVGSFTSEELKAFLRDVRENQPEAKLRLTIHTSLNTENTAIFQIISKAKEEAVQQEIANLKEDNKLLLHLSRAGIYRRNRLIIEAAAEYEEALKFSLESIALLRATAAIEEQAGNLKRSNELEVHIGGLVKGPK